MHNFNRSYSRKSQKKNTSQVQTQTKINILSTVEINFTQKIVNKTTQTVVLESVHLIATYIIHTTVIGTIQIIAKI